MGLYPVLHHGWPLRESVGLEVQNTGEQLLVLEQGKKSFLSIWPPDVLGAAHVPTTESTEWDLIQA